MGELYLAFLDEINKNYSVDTISDILTRKWWVPILAVSLYMLLVALGKMYMEKRKPYSLRSLLFSWNVLLALFSILGSIAMVPTLVQSVLEKGFLFTTCNTPIHAVPMQAFFCFIFVLSKIVEFGDTFFIVLRKTPLNFLHWYHHVTVCLFSWHSLAIKSAPGHWYCAMNYSVHSVMYTYYVFKSFGYRIPKQVALGVTLLQLLQFFVGLVVVLSSAVLFVSGVPCQINYLNISAGMFIYISYFVLFGNFFYHRYISKPAAAAAGGGQKKKLN